MPVIISDDVPSVPAQASATRYLSRRLAAIQDIRPLRILFLNLMPHVLETETQILRLLANTPQQVDVTLVRDLTSLANHRGNDQLLDHYRSFTTVRNDQFDAAIVIGEDGLQESGRPAAPPWDQIAEVLDWSRLHVRSTLFIGWAARAAVAHFHEILPCFLPERMVTTATALVHQAFHPLVAGFDEQVPVPVARAIRHDATIQTRNAGLLPLLSSADCGVHLLHHAPTRRTYLFDHLEASAGMYRRELRRHALAPANGRQPLQPATWRGQVHLLLANWLDAEVYQPLSLPSRAVPEASPDAKPQQQDRFAESPLA